MLAHPALFFYNKEGYKLMLNDSICQEDFVLKKKPLIITCILLVAAIALTVAVFGFGLGKKKETEQPKASPNAAASYQALSTTADFADHPLLPTDFDGVFYTADPNGNFEFYEYKNGAFTKIDASGTVTATVSLSNQNIPAKITYLKRDGKVDGYGLFTTAISDAPVAIYDYGFFHVKTMPEKFSGDALLLLDTKKDDFYKPDKVYEEAYTLNLSTGKTKVFLLQKSRTIGENGGSRSDFTLLTDALVDNAGSRLLFFTGRYYAEDSEKRDVMFRTGSTQTHGFANADYNYARSTDKGIVFLRKTDKGFNVMRFSNEKEAVLKEFEGTFGTDYLLSGDTLIGKNGTVYNLATQKEQAFDAPGLKELAAAAVSPDGKRLVLAGTPENGTVNEQRIVYVDLEAGKQKAFTGADLFRLETPELTFIGNDTVFHNRKSTQEGKACQLCAIEWAKVFAE